MDFTLLEVYLTAALEFIFSNLSFEKVVVWPVSCNEEEHAFWYVSTECWLGRRNSPFEFMIASR